MPLPPEILDAIHEVELRLTDARRQANRGRHPNAAAVGMFKAKAPRAGTEGTQADAIGVLTRQLAALWAQYRAMVVR